MQRFWLFVHIAAALSFTLTHGASAAMMFKIRGERDPARIGAMLDLSLSLSVAMGVSLLVLLAAGIAGAFTGNLWGEGWVWVSLVLFVAITGLMTPLAAGYYNRVREAVGVQTWGQARKAIAPGPPRSTEEIAALLQASPAWIITALGGGGLLVILWLMIFKPF